MTLACRLLGDSTEAEDALHTVFGRLLSRTSPPLGFGAPYLFGAVRKECLQRIRNRDIHALALASLPVEQRAQPSPESEIVARCDLRRILAEMTDRQREVWFLRAQGYSYDQIAEQLGISANTVNALVQRGRDIGRRERERERERASERWGHSAVTRLTLRLLLVMREFHDADRVPVVAGTDAQAGHVTLLPPAQRVRPVHDRQQA
jgi:RNA polymerase sigma factor (sigma-70 family)